MRVAVVGSGPAGCIAAWACHLHGVQADVYTALPQPSALRGAQYLHSPFVLPGGFEPESESVAYAKLGSREIYAKKIYGSGFDPGKTSWDKFPRGIVKAWPLREIYKTLHEWATPRFLFGDVDRKIMRMLCEENDLVFNSAPAHLFSQMDYTIRTEKVLVTTAESGETDGNNLIVYDGTSSTPHYRYSFLEGVESYEYPGNTPLELIPQGPAVEVSKPLSIDKPPMHEKIVPIGRYGRWEKGVLVDGVFKQVTRIVEQYPR